MAKKEMVLELKESDFSKIINDKKDNLVIVDFFAEWCMPCIMMAPIIERLAKKNPKVRFCKINVDDAGKLATEYEISSIPCIVFFKDGKEVDRVVATVNEYILDEKIKDYIKK